MATALQVFPYPPLPVGVDAIRILTVEPGDFSDPLVGTLTSVAFSMKPRYVGLSYTWEDPYKDNAALPSPPKEVNSSQQLSESISANPASQGDASLEPRVLNDQALGVTLPSVQSGVLSTIREPIGTSIITLNGYPFPIHRNLCLAMLHLRSPAHPLALWVDAICINQAEMSERNAQVAMMSFIYTRAVKVVAWLGVMEYRNKLNVFQAMASDWKAGQLRNFASSMAAGGAKLHYSLEPDQSTFARVAESTYWTRLWVVQEACLPRLLVFAYGSKIWTCENFLQWEVLKAARSRSQLPRNSDDLGSDRLQAMLRLLDTRNAKFTDAMRLENLIEAFANSGCGELRDRVYGLLGLANDSCPLSRSAVDADSVDEYIKSLDLQQDRLPEPERGSGSFRIDYSRSLYDIWTDVVKFAFFRAKNIEGRFHCQTWLVRSRAVTARSISLLEEERRISVVRTAGIAQKALGQMVEVEVTNSTLPKESYVSGEIVHLGPTYTSLVGSFRAQQDWLGCWGSYYQKPADLEMLRRINEKYTAKIMEYEDKDLNRIRGIWSPTTVAWRVATGSRPKSAVPGHAFVFDKKRDCVDDTDQFQAEGPRICLGTDYLMTVVPSDVQIGDVVIRFWNCDAAILMRPINSHVKTKGVGDGTNGSFMLVGRADVAELLDQNATPGFDTRAEKAFLVGYPGFENAAAVYIDLNFRTLQIITASISA